MRKAIMTSSEISKFLGVQMVGTDRNVTWVTTLDHPQDGCLAFCVSSDSPVLSRWSESGGIILAPAGAAVPDGCVHLVSENPRRDFGLAVSRFFVEEDLRGIAPSASIHESVQIGSDVTVGENVVIERDVILGRDVVIGHNTTILARTRVGQRSVIGSNTVIGSIGFGFEKDDNGDWIRLPHVGGVLIGDDVEIGSSTVIARGTILDTTIGDNCKIDDNVFIAHNVVIGANTVVIANSEISGSVRIGRDSWIAPSVTVIQGVSIGENSLVGIGSVVIRDVPDNVVVAGNPAKALREQPRSI